MSAKEYDATLIRIIDGDTVVVRVDLGLGVSVEKHVRIEAIDCPEMNAHIPGYHARNACVEWWNRAGGVATLITEGHTDAHGRTLGDFAQKTRGRLVNHLSAYLLKHGCKPL